MLYATVLVFGVGCSLSHERGALDSGPGEDAGFDAAADRMQFVDTGVSVADSGPARDSGPAVDAATVDSVDGHYVGVIAGDDINGTFDVTIEEGTWTGSATLEDGSTERTDSLEVVSGDPSSGPFEVRVGDFRGDATLSDGSLEIELQPADGGGAVAQGAGTRTEEGGDFFCGTYSGDDDGRWNLVITEEGKQSGSFWGSQATGTVAGRQDGSIVSGEWHGTSASGFEVSGSTIGTISGDSIGGTWSGSGYSGTWMTTQTCPGD